MRRAYCVMPFTPKAGRWLLHENPSQRFEVGGDGQCDSEAVWSKSTARTLIGPDGHPVAAAGLWPWAGPGDALLWSLMRSDAGKHVHHVVGAVRRFIAKHEGEWPAVYSVTRTEHGPRLLKLLSFHIFRLAPPELAANGFTMWQHVPHWARN